MGKTKRYDGDQETEGRTESRRHKKLKGRNTKRHSERTGRKSSKAELNRLIGFTNRERKQIPNKTTIKAMELSDAGLELHEFDTVEEMLEDLHEPNDERP